MNLPPRSPGRRRLLLTLAALSVAAVHCAPSSSPDDEESGEAVAPEALLKEPSFSFGTWRSVECEAVDAATYQLRTDRIAANGVFADWERFSSAACAPSTKLYTIRMGGSSKLDRLSGLVGGALEVRVFIDEKAIVPASPEGQSRLRAECPAVPFRQGEETDVTRTGCGGIVPPHEQCPVEYDLMKLGWKTLTFGDRARPLCTEGTRPTSLSRWRVGFLHLGG